MKRLSLFMVPLMMTVLLGGFAAPAGAASTDVLVSNGSPPAPFSQNKQNEPAVAVDAKHPNVLAAGSNDNIDMEACNAGLDTDCPFTPGVGASGIYFSFDSGQSWTQPTYTGLTARDCLGQPGNTDPPCSPHVGPIGTLPKYSENGLVSDGDPAVAFGPRPKNGKFSWANGSRLYYANLTSNCGEPGCGSGGVQGFEGIGVSRTDNVTAAAAGSNNAWKKPVIASKQNSALFADKEQIWADNAASSKFFGNTYVCYAGFRGIIGTSQPLFVTTSRDGGNTWTQKQVTSAANNTSSQQGFGRSGCTIRTDSQGVVYVYAYSFGASLPGIGEQILVKSFDGGRHWTRPQHVQTAVDTCNAFEPSIGRCVEDGVGGARDDLSPSPSVDIANGAPSGKDATDRQVLTWVDGRDGLNHEHVMFTSSSNDARTWSPLRQVEQPNTNHPAQQAMDRGYYSAPAISPNGTDVYLVYNAFTTPYRDNTTAPRGLIGVVLHANVTGAGAGAIGTFSQIHRGAEGDPRGSSQNNLAAEFLGDYVYAAATRTYGVAVWNDTRNAAVCPAINAYRQALHNEALASGVRTAEAEEPRGVQDREQFGSQKDQGADATAPAVQQVCPGTFGNSDIYGFTTK
ncbi:MAG: hypothetical protein QOG21_564 [Actinomycetota bacterium]|nr:hypothetical protein [Actinomycetota bacterium]